MSTVEQIKTATASLSPQEQLELYRWLTGSKGLRKLWLSELQRDIAIGAGQADRGELVDGKEVFQELHEKFDKSAGSQK